MGERQCHLFILQWILEVYEQFSQEKENNMDNNMEYIESIVQERLKECKWRILSVISARISNDDNDVINGYYQVADIRYTDVYDANFVEEAYFKGNVLIGWKSETDTNKIIRLYVNILNKNLDIYNIIETTEELSLTDIDILVCKLLSSNELNKNVSIREFVKTETYNTPDRFDRIENRLDKLENEGAVDNKRLCRAIEWLRNKNISDEDIIDCLLFVYNFNPMEVNVN